MDSFEQVLPKLVKIQLFSDFDPASEEDQRILKAVYDNLGNGRRKLKKQGKRRWRGKELQSEIRRARCKQPERR